jgi:hypothetical protein
MVELLICGFAIIPSCPAARSYLAASLTVSFCLTAMDRSLVIAPRYEQNGSGFKNSCLKSDPYPALSCKYFSWKHAFGGGKKK